MSTADGYTDAPWDTLGALPPDAETVEVVLDTPTLDDPGHTTTITVPRGHDLDPGDEDGPARALATLPERLEGAAHEALVDYRDRDAVNGLVQDVRGRVLTAVRQEYAVHLAGRTAALLRRDGGASRPTSTDVAAELRFLADAENVLGGLADSLKAGADEARSIAGDVILDVDPDRELGTATVKVGVPGGTLKATRSQSTKVEARGDEIVDVVVSMLVGNLEQHSPPPGEVKAHAAGAREGIAAVLALCSAPSWKTTALDDLARRLEAAGEDALAIRLSHAYGRVASGKSSTKLVVEPAKGAKA